MMTDDVTRLAETENWVRVTGVSRRATFGGAAMLAGYALAAQPVSAGVITTSTKGLDAGMVTVPTAGLTMSAYRARPAGHGPHPVILVIHEIFGLHEWIRDIVRRLAAAGYYAIAPDLYQRHGDATKVADIQTLFTTIVAKADDAQVASDLDATLAFAGREGGRVDHAGVTGFCWGGRQTWLYAAHNSRIRVGVAWYGPLAGAPSPLRPHSAIDLAASVKPPVLGLYGGLDHGITADDRARMSAALAAAHSRSSITSFPQADHGFLADYRPSYNEAAAHEGWAKAMAWFKANL